MDRSSWKTVPNFIYSYFHKINVLLNVCILMSCLAGLKAVKIQKGKTGGGRYGGYWLGRCGIYTR